MSKELTVNIYTELLFTLYSLLIVINNLNFFLQVLQISVFYFLWNESILTNQNSF